ncbi:MAG: response regulator [Candidatus Omnitrophica bacterium]|nr:response regulator [Candidatus Omnitrophota bacterium]MBU4477995.1 response regulator [Candidatus Omnitrophota bacterium]MCG2703928.1 response regulator [Candidatus Omnitrophota bacterium]
MNADVYILIIDGEAAVLNSFADVFSKEGYQVLKAGSWQEALPQIKAQKFNVVIADVCLPDISCREMAETIREENRYAFVITTAGFSDIELARESIQYGAHDYLSKPFDPVDIVVSMRKIVEKQRLQSDSKQLFDTIKVLALALDARDHYTHGHSEQVTEYALMIAGEMMLAKEELDKIRDAGILHDIGKIGIPDAILLKPGRLTEEEYNEIKKHPEIGKKILEPVDCLADKIPLIYHHHERFDGKGYPCGLRGEEIPLGARILTVADAYQAMTSDRPYRKALPVYIAVEELIIGKDKQFDARIVDVFLRVLKRKGVDCARR